MLANTYSPTSVHSACRVARRLALVCSVVSALVLTRPTAAQPKGHTPAFAGTWEATDAVDDYERAAVIVIRRKGDAYELVDPSLRPRQVLRGRARGTKLTFVQRHAQKTTTYTFTLQRGGHALTGDTYDGQSRLVSHFVRVSHRPKQARIQHRHP